MKRIPCLIIFIAFPNDQQHKSQLLQDVRHQAYFIKKELEKETKCIIEVIELATFKDIVDNIAVKNQDTFVHFIAHGIEEYIYLEDNKNFYEVKSDPLGGKTLKQILSSSEHVKCVTFSSCNSHKIAEIIKDEVEFSVGYKGELHSEIAKDFFRYFYIELIKNNKSYDEAFNKSNYYFLHKKDNPGNGIDDDDEFCKFQNCDLNKPSNEEFFLNEPPYIKFTNIKLDYCPIEGNALHPIDDVELELRDEEIVLPEDLKNYSNRKREYLESKIKDKKVWNGKRFSLYEFIQTRYEKDEKIRLILKFKKTDYANFLSLTKELDTLNTVLDENGNPTTFRNKYFPAFNIEEPNPYFTHSFGVNLLVITNDNMAVFIKRSCKVANKGNLFHISMNEGMDELDLIKGKPSIYNTAFRGLHEELGLPKEMKKIDLKFFSFGVLPIENEYGVLGRAKIDFDSETLYDYYIKRAKDRGLETTNKLYFEDYSLKNILDFISEHKPWVSHGLATVYYSLCYDFGHENIDNELEMIKLDDDTVKRITFVSNSSLLI